jgi:glucose/arabinose dehydrogenase
MLNRGRSRFRSILFIAACVGVLPPCNSQTTPFHGARATEAARRNPYAADASARDDGKVVFASTCAACHGANGEGAGVVPALRSETIRQASDGELFWYITRGDVNNGMPSWAALPEEKRWHVVSYLRSLKDSASAPAPKSAEPSAAAPITTPAPSPPFTDFRYEAPGKGRKITVADLPQPYATSSAGNRASIVARPASAWPKAPAGFKVVQFASGIPGPRLLRTAPNGDVFAALNGAGKIALLRGIDADGKAEKSVIFASGLNKPFGIAFYPPGPDPKWIYVGNTNAVVRYAYANGDLGARGTPEHIADLPSGGGHSTRDIVFRPTEKSCMYRLDPHRMSTIPTRPSPRNAAPTSSRSIPRAAASACLHTASAIRSAWRSSRGPGRCGARSTNAMASATTSFPTTSRACRMAVSTAGRGGTSARIRIHAMRQTPRPHGQSHRPDVLLQPHSASLQLTFYDGAQFPADYRGDIFAAQHGSWNRSTRAGYEVIRVPLHQSGQASGEYEDFLTGFVLDSGEVWGRPVGVTVASDGSLLVSDDASNSIWRVSYAGEPSASPAR